QIDERQGELALVELEHRAHGAADRYDLVALALQRESQVVGDDRLVVDHEDVWLHARSVCRMIHNPSTAPPKARKRCHSADSAGAATWSTERGQAKSVACGC